MMIEKSGQNPIRRQAFKIDLRSSTINLQSSRIDRVDGPLEDLQGRHDDDEVNDRFARTIYDKSPIGHCLNPECFEKQR